MRTAVMETSKMTEAFNRRTSLPLLVIPIALAMVVRLAVIFHYGPYVSIHSDDMGYYHSAEWLLNFGTYSYYTPLRPTVHMMPGITFLLAGIIAVFGHGALGLYAGKIVFSVIGVLGIVGAWKAVDRMWNGWVACVVALALAVYPPMVEVDTLFLTEAVFMASFAWTVYYLLKMADSRQLRDVVMLSIFFMISMYFRPNILLWAVVGLVYLLMKRYPKGLLFKHMGVAIGIFIVCMMPWWIRNEVVFHHFIPLTDDSSNPLLLGTFQGMNAPEPAKALTVEHQILRQHPNLKPQRLHEIPWFQAERHAAIYRVREWLRTNPASFFQSYLLVKPGILWLRAYFPIRMMGVDAPTLRMVQPWIIWVSLIGYGMALLFGRNRRRELIMVLLSLLYFTALFSVFFAYERYNVPIEWLMMMGAPAGLWAIGAAAVRTVRGRSRRRRRRRALSVR